MSLPGVLFVCSALTTIGVPWVSEPHTKMVFRPCLCRDLTKISAGTYVRRCPIWHSPFAYGSPQVTRTGLSAGKFDIDFESSIITVCLKQYT